MRVQVAAMLSAGATRRGTRRQVRCSRILRDAVAGVREALFGGPGEMFHEDFALFFSPCTLQVASELDYTAARFECWLRFALLGAFRTQCGRGIVSFA